MLRARIIPCLLVKDKGLVKTTQFSNPKYVGDPINAVRIFNEKEVDELMVLDIDATVKGSEPDYRRIENLAAECSMPLCYGGGVRTVAQVEKIIKLGVEKVALSAAAIANPSLIADIAKCVGSQSVVVVMDVKKNTKNGQYSLWTNNATQNSGLEPVVFAQKMQALGVGEVVVNAIHYDGMMKGYDLELIRRIRQAVDVPITALGGAGGLEDIKDLIQQHAIIGAAAGSLFVFKGIYRAVLINYPSYSQKMSLLQTEQIEGVI